VVNSTDLGALTKLKSVDWWREKCATDLYFLCRVVLQTLEDPTPGFKDLYKPTHGRMASFIGKYATPGNNLLLLTPRHWIKSYLVTIGWLTQRMLQTWLKGGRESAIISNATRPNSLEFLRKIKYNLMYNTFLRQLFEKWIPEDLENHAPAWTQELIEVSGFRIETGSAEGNLVSRHYPIMVNDDLVNKDNASTAEQIEKVKDWWKLSKSLLSPNGISIQIGTRWDFDDLYGFIIESFLDPPRNYHETSDPIIELHKGSYHLMQMDCWSDPVNETGSTFPVLFPEEKLKQLEKEQAEHFYGQYRNNPLAKGNTPFKKSWIQRYSPISLPEQRFHVWLMDPTGKAKEKSDYTGHVSLFYGVDKKVYVDYAKRLKITDKKLVDYIIEVGCLEKPDAIRIEDNKFNIVREMMEIILPQMIRMGKIAKKDLSYAKSLPYILEPLAPRGRPKEVRVKHTTGWVERGNVLFPYSGADILEQEMVRFGASRYDDVVDAFAYFLDDLAWPSKDFTPKRFELTAEEKMTDEERERAEWDEALEQANNPQGDLFEECW
jgi:hypothetical protein